MVKTNGWKKAFFALVIIELCGMLLLAGFVLFPGGNSRSLPKTELKEGQYVPFKIHTNKDDLNKVIEHYIKEKNLNGSVNYRVHLSNEVELYGTVKVFTENLQLKMTFVPKALKNGDLVLKEKSVSLGSMNLPDSYILTFISHSYKLPEWISINPSKKTVYVGLTQMKLKSNARVKANQFNLKENQIAFTLLFPAD